MVWGAVVALIWSRLADGSLGILRNSIDWRGHLPHGCELALSGVEGRSEIPWPLTPDTVPSPLAMFDLSVLLSIRCETDHQKRAYPILVTRI